MCMTVPPLLVGVNSGDGRRERGDSLSAHDDKSCPLPPFGRRESGAGEQARSDPAQFMGTRGEEGKRSGIRSPPLQEESRTPRPIQIAVGRGGEDGRGHSGAAYGTKSGSRGRVSR